MASSTISQPASKAAVVYRLTELWRDLFEELKVMQFDEWTTRAIRNSIRSLAREMNKRENVVDLVKRGQMLAQASALLSAKIAAYEMLEEEIDNAGSDEMAGGYQAVMERMVRLETAAQAWADVYTA
jgi:cell fate (sporulation/competence/biofilm development) regulator YlbF (YheA/YmcA/DUF963 family)